MKKATDDKLIQGLLAQLAALEGVDIDELLTEAGEEEAVETHTSSANFTVWDGDETDVEASLHDVGLPQTTQYLNTDDDEGVTEESFGNNSLIPTIPTVKVTGDIGEVDGAIVVDSEPEYFNSSKDDDATEREPTVTTPVVTDTSTAVVTDTPTNNGDTSGEPPASSVEYEPVVVINSEQPDAQTTTVAPADTVDETVESVTTEALISEDVGAVDEQITDALAENTTDEVDEQTVAEDIVDAIDGNAAPEIFEDTTNGVNETVDESPTGDEDMIPPIVDDVVDLLHGLPLEVEDDIIDNIMNAVEEVPTELEETLIDVSEVLEDNTPSDDIDFGNLPEQECTGHGWSFFDVWIPDNNPFVNSPVDESRENGVEVIIFDW